MQVGIKMEFQNHQGRIAVFVGNKTPMPFNNLAPPSRRSPPQLQGANLLVRAGAQLLR